MGSRCFSLSMSARWCDTHTCSRGECSISKQCPKIIHFSWASLRFPRLLLARLWCDRPTSQWNLNSFFCTRLRSCVASVEHVQLNRCYWNISQRNIILRLVLNFLFDRFLFVSFSMSSITRHYVYGCASCSMFMCIIFILFFFTYACFVCVEHNFDSTILANWNNGSVYVAETTLHCLLSTSVVVHAESVRPTTTSIRATFTNSG